MTEIAPTHTEAQRVEILSTLAACDGMPKRAERRLAELGVDIRWTEIRTLREEHDGLYRALAVERERAAEEALVVEFRELARLGQRVTRNYLEDLLDKQEEGTLDYNEQRALPQIIQAMAKVQQVSVDKLLAMTGRPTDGGRQDPLAAAKALVEMGVLQPVERPAIEGTAEEVS